MQRALRACSEAGCRALTRDRYCKEHKRTECTTEGRRQDKRFYSRKSWRDFRSDFLEQNPLCKNCLSFGRYTSATEVHHVVERKKDESRAFDPTNCEALCKSCHSRHTGQSQTEARREKKTATGGEEF